MHARIGEGIAIHEQQVGKVSRTDHAEFVAPPHDLAADARRGARSVPDGDFLFTSLYQ
jgi:hypothetical protein